MKPSRIVILSVALVAAGLAGLVAMQISGAKQVDTSIYRIFYRRRDDLRPTAEFGGPFNVGISAFLLLSEPLRIMRRRVFLHGTRIGACCRRCWPCRSSPWPC